MIKFLKNHFLQRKKIAELEAEIKRLEKIIKEPVLAGMELLKHEFTMTTGGVAPQILAGMLVDILDQNPDAENYVEVKFWNEKHGNIVVTVFRHRGKTPHELRMEAEAKLNAFLSR